MEEIHHSGEGPRSDRPDYKLYCLGGDGKITRSEWIDAQNDQDAIAIARAMGKSVDCEIWKGNRLVARVPAAKKRA
jgi:hypothetical protein